MARTPAGGHPGQQAQSWADTHWCYPALGHTELPTGVAAVLTAAPWQRRSLEPGFEPRLRSSLEGVSQAGLGSALVTNIPKSPWLCLKCLFFTHERARVARDCAGQRACLSPSPAAAPASWPGRLHGVACAFPAGRRVHGGLPPRVHAAARVTPERPRARTARGLGKSRLLRVRGGYWILPPPRRLHTAPHTQGSWARAAWTPGKARPFRKPARPDPGGAAGPGRAALRAPGDGLARFFPDRTWDAGESLPTDKKTQRLLPALPLIW